MGSIGSSSNAIITKRATTGTDLETNSAAMEMDAAAKDLGLNVTTQQVVETDLLGTRHYSSEVTGKASDIEKLFAEMRRRKGL